MPTAPATTDQFKTFFDRDFPFGSGKDSVRDSDIDRAFNDAATLFKSGLWADETKRRTAYLYLSAHVLALNLQSAGGLSATSKGRGAVSGGAGLIQSKSAGQMSATYVFPDRVAKSPILSGYLRTQYGQRYLQLFTAAGGLCGNIQSVDGFSEFDEYPSNGPSA